MRKVLIIVTICAGITIRSVQAQDESCAPYRQKVTTWQGEEYRSSLPCKIPEWDTTRPLPITPVVAEKTALKALAPYIQGREVRLTHIELATRRASENLLEWYFAVQFSDLKGDIPSTIHALVLMDGKVITPQVAVRHR
jgi:hypothetical protein